MAKGEQTRKDIIDQAFTLAGEIGLKGLSLGVLAANAGLSKSGLFAHFKSKEALQFGVIDEALDRFTAMILRPALRQPRGEPRVRALFERYLAWKAHHKSSGCLFMTLSREFDDRPGPIRDRLVTIQRDWDETIRRVAASAVDNGDFRGDVDVDLFAYEFLGIGMAHHHVLKFLEHPRAERLAHAAFDALLDRSRAAALSSHLRS